MTNKEMEKALEQIATSLITTAQLQATLAVLVHEGFTSLRDQTAALLEITREHGRRLNGLEGNEGTE
jgi:hypothetical protein